MATTSACAVGSFARVTRFAPSAMMRFSLTINAANGPPPPERTFSSASAMARLMNSWDTGLPFYRASDWTVRPKIATCHFADERNHFNCRAIRPAHSSGRTCKIMKWRYDVASYRTVFHLFSSSGGATAHDSYPEYLPPRSVTPQKPARI